MTLTLQNLRAVGSGVTPPALFPGQFCINLEDLLLFTGNGSNVKVSLDGTVEPGQVGKGWFTSTLDPTYYLINPDQSSTPQAGYIVTYDDFLQKPVWSNPAGFDRPEIYITTNDAVATAPGSTLSDQITNAIGQIPMESDMAIVEGLPGQPYPALYLYKNGTWEFSAINTNPTAQQVNFSAPVGVGANNTQSALDLLFAGKLDVATNDPAPGDILSWDAEEPVWIATEDIVASADKVTYNPIGTDVPVTDNTVQKAITSTASTAGLAKAGVTQINQTALFRTGGTMSGQINFVNNQIIDAGTY